MARSEEKKALLAKRAVAKGVYRKKPGSSFKRAEAIRKGVIKLGPRRQPQYPARAIAPRPLVDANKTIIAPVISETAIQQIENSNTLVLEVHLRATKADIREAVKTVLKADAAKINTLVRPDGSKKAYVRLAAGSDALVIASQAGFV